MDFKEYIRGKRRGKEANRLEREAMDDPFLQDAIDGYDSHEADHIPAIEALERRVARRHGRNDKRRLWVWSAAALLLLLVGTQLFLRIRPQKMIDTQVASSEQTQRQLNEIPPATSLPDSAIRDQNNTAETKATPAPLKGRAPNATKPAETPPPVTLAEELTMHPPQEDEGRRHPQIVAGGNDTQLLTRTAKSADSKITILPANQKLIAGRIVDETGEPIIGASVAIKDRQTGAVTDIDGNFTIPVPKEEKGTVVASFIGMKTTEAPLKDSMGDITLKSGDMALNEVVVVGYGTKNRRSGIKPVSKATDSIPAFGEAEFCEYFKKNRDKSLCPGQPVSIKASFYIGDDGRPSGIRIKEMSCPAMEAEFKRLLIGSPVWSARNRNVELTVEL